MNQILYLSLLLFCLGCRNSNANTEKYANWNDNTIDVKSEIAEIKMNDMLINGNSSLYLIDKYLIISDYKSIDTKIHLFNRNDFKYVASTGYAGQGPGEITNMGSIGIDEQNHRIYVIDHGKQVVFCYPLDSIITNPFYTPEVKAQLDQKRFPHKFYYINDTLSIGLIIEPIGSNNFNTSIAKWNMNTGKVEFMKYNHPEIKKKRINFTVDTDNKRYVESYTYHDLITICDLEGNLKCNLYGSNWGNEKSNKMHCFGDVVFCKDKIVASYSGGDNRTDDYYPTKFIIFDLNGEYIKTLKTGYMIFNFCYDKYNDRIIMSLNDEIQFAYLDMNKHLN